MKNRDINCHTTSGVDGRGESQSGCHLLSSDVLRASRVAGAAQASGPGWRASGLRNRGAGNPARWARKRTATACCALRVFHPSARTARRPGARTGSRAAPRALRSAARRLPGESHAVSAPGHATLGRQETHRTSDTILEPACVPVGRRGNAFYRTRRGPLTCGP